MPKTKTKVKVGRPGPGPDQPVETLRTSRHRRGGLDSGRQAAQLVEKLTEAQRQELQAIAGARHEEDRLQEVLEERRAGHSSGSAPRVEKQIGSITFRYETVRCGKENCSRCPHGPYWYAYWKEGGRTRSRYIGRSLPVPALQSYEEKRRARLEKA